MTSLNRSERERHHALVQKLVSSQSELSELANGFLLTIRAGLSPAEVAEWVSLEVRCCPFVTFTLELGPDQPSVVRLTGPEGVKRFLVAELGLS